jgi:hypothetical protein
VRTVVYLVTPIVAFAGCYAIYGLGVAAVRLVMPSGAAPRRIHAKNRRGSNAEI